MELTVQSSTAVLHSAQFIMFINNVIKQKYSSHALYNNASVVVYYRSPHKYIVPVEHHWVSQYKYTCDYEWDDWRGYPADGDLGEFPQLTHTIRALTTQTVDTVPLK